jgi:hypothetical protein
MSEPMMLAVVGVALLGAGIVKDLLDSAWSGQADATGEDEDW